MYNHTSFSGRYPQFRRLLKVALALLVLFALSAVLSGCSANTGSVTVTQEEREVAFRSIAGAYAGNGDLAAAQAELDKLGLANPAQLIVSLAESDLAAGRSKEEIEPLARLASALGVRSPKLIAVLAPSPAPAATAAPPSPTAPPPTETAVVPTVAPPSATPEPATATPAPTLPPTAVPASATPPPQEPRVVAESSVNLRSGPGKAYPVIGRLNPGQEVDIVGRNASGDWWRLNWPGNAQAWVAGTVVKVLGAIDTVAEVRNIPPAPTAAPRPTAAPQPTAAPPPPSVPHFKLIVRRLWTLEENGGYLAGGLSVNCEGNEHLLHVYVKDAAGNLLDGVTIKEAGGGQQELVSGSKGPGMAEYNLYPPGKDVYVIRDVDGRQVTSDTGAAPTIPIAIPYDLLQGSHYCRDDADCARLVGEFGCGGHYSWDIVFQRSY